MDESALTSQAIAELMRELPGQNGIVSYEPLERKINPLGKPNKKFLGRTINSALRHNKREIERTQASCKQKLRELDDRYERRKRNAFYTHNARNNESAKRRGHANRRSIKQSKKQHRSRSRSSSIESRSRSPSRCRTHKPKHKKNKHKRKIKRQCKSRSTCSSEEEDVRSPLTVGDESKVPTSAYYMHSNNLALAVAMAYGQVLRSHQSQVKEPTSPASPSSDIIRELMSDDETKKDQNDLPETLSIASSSGDEVRDIVTIDLSSQEEQSVGCSETDSETKSNAASCISLKDSVKDDDLASNSGSDIELVEQESDQPIKQQIQIRDLREELVDIAGSSSDFVNTVDLTED
ncbi:uncharacterized protein LOC6557937 [Drosophila grimshawi]|uniref:uncharacterized protein LOC6557937 n=1 Tax=Drosophila grimshawi TaxID=7222 RepID=UPI000C86E775|nr:uncharacterized protein LOC6557937 [Drosophila grimshawi]